jgi:hypothetical protein
MFARSSRPSTMKALTRWSPSRVADVLRSFRKNRRVLSLKRRCVRRICWVGRLLAGRWTSFASLWLGRRSSARSALETLRQMLRGAKVRLQRTKTWKECNDPRLASKPTFVEVGQRDASGSGRSWSTATWRAEEPFEGHRRHSYRGLLQ